ncbi:DUF389 domain-containing protein [Haloprofundus sp. MHR1]|uniref:DUF389 domain-containing protein n=1 Tax=Haloprofundus sp. MHR1 TaxID=2572921 RepID=UPI0010BF5BAB|nr:DUF389 domain-containing protein [Haloprofundus sp. MHR1]QCJ48315.1 DUF389 domain-containing protein [Haloprofundus sp. MHR1]
MRHVHIFVPAEERPAVEETLSELDVDYAVTSDGSGTEAKVLFQFPVPVDGVREVLEDLHDAGVEEGTYTVVGSAEAVLTPNVDRLQKRYAQDFTPLAEFELQSKAESLSRDDYSYVWMLFLSAIIATAGLLIDSPAIVVGSMVIAPIMGPILTATVGATTSNWEMCVAGVRQQVLGLGVAVVGATVTAFALKELSLVSSTLAPASIELVSLRLAPSSVAILVGVAAGAAATFGVTTKGPLSLIGVMVAAALIPAAGVTGIGVAWGAPLLVLGTLLLLAATVLAIDVAMIATLSFLGYRSSVDSLRGYLQNDAVNVPAVALAALVLFAGVGVVTVGTVQQVNYQRTVNQQVEEVLGQQRYSDLQATSVSVQYAYPVGFAERETVTVTVTRTTDRSYSSLPSEIQREIRAETGQNPVVRVRFVDYSQTNYSSSASAVGVSSDSISDSASSPTLAAGITSTAAT